MTKDKNDTVTGTLEGVPVASVAETAAKALAPFLKKRVDSMTKSLNAVEAELAVVENTAGFESRIKYLKARRDLFAIAINNLTKGV